MRGQTYNYFTSVLVPVDDFLFYYWQVQGQEVPLTTAGTLLLLQIVLLTGNSPQSSTVLATSVICFTELSNAVY